MKLDEAITAGERLVQDARQIADQFHDPMGSDLARDVTTGWSVDRWMEKKERWAGLAFNVLNYDLHNRAVAEHFRRVTGARAGTRTQVDHLQRLDDGVSAVERGLGELRSLHADLPPDGSQQVSANEDQGGGAETLAPETGNAVVSLDACVFVVHGRNEALKTDVARTLERSGDHPVVVLHELPDRGRTIIEKFEEEASRAAYAVILLTDDDVGRLKDGDTEQPRARQNVIFELGWFVGRLGRHRITVLYKGQTEIPSDYAGVTYTQVDEEGAWRRKLTKELRAAGMSYDANRLG